MRLQQRDGSGRHSVAWGLVRQHLLVLFLCMVMAWSVVALPVTAYAATHISPAPGNSKAILTKSPPALQTVPSKNAPSADTNNIGGKPLTGTGDATQQEQIQFIDKLTGKAADTGSGLSAPGKSTTSAITPHELVQDRTATSDVTLNADGTYTERAYTSSHYYKNSSGWQPIDTSIITDDNAADSTNIFGKALGKVESLVGTPDTFTIKANDWKARFAPTDDAVGMIRVQEGDNELSFTPVNGAKVTPVLKTEDGQQSVWYYGVWSGVDVQYVVTSDSLKENIILNNKDAVNNVAFTISGGTLVTAHDPSNPDVAYTIDGAGDLGKNFAIAKFSISLNKYGFEADQPITSSYSDGQLSISVDEGYLQKLPSDAFPLTIDPTVTRSNFGTRTSGNYKSFKSDGYICDSTVCNPMAGSVLDTNNVWRAWRGAIMSPYTFLKGKVFISASLHLTQRTGLSVSGTTATEPFYAQHATCLTSINCVGGTKVGPVNIASSGNINVTPIYQAALNGGDYGAWLMIEGKETTATTYKNWDPANSYVNFTYANPTPTPGVTTPVANQTFVTTQPSFDVGALADPNGGSLQYDFCVSTSAGCNGLLVDSGNVASPQWTVPQNVLQDGNTYYVQARAFDTNGGGTSSFSSAVPFKINLRRGTDNTQTADALGPVNVDLGTGNLSTSAASHTSTALGGSLGVELNYNSPVTSSPGLIGSYWNNGAGSASAPQMQRVDQNVDFTWGPGNTAGSPGAPISTTNWQAQWNGYFVAPQSGTYMFGAVNDDAMTISVDGTQVYNVADCFSGTPCYGSGIILTAGQVVQFQANYAQGTFGDEAHIWVQTPDGKGQVVPSNWFQTGVRPTANSHGLVGHYYKDDGTHTIPTNPNAAFLTRTDSLLSFNWPGTSPIPNGPTAYTVRWTGYFTAPVTGTYSFGAQADDGSRITVNGTQVENNWQAGGFGLLYGSSVSLAAGQAVPITVDYFQAGGPGDMYLYVKGAVSEQVVPSAWLTTKAQVLPDGWNLGLDPGGNANYDHLTATDKSVVLYDSAGDTHEYTWNGTKYLPPTGEDGQLAHNGDGTYTLQDSDGQTYVFNADGTLQSLTSATDDRNPAALQYAYGGTPAALTRISDGVNSSRYAALYYSGDGQDKCGSAPDGFDAAPPAGMLCAVITNDGRATYFYYLNGNLARIVQPGNVTTDYQYDTLGRIVAIRDAAANDAITAGVRSADDTTLTQIQYDDIGRVTGVTEPQANADATPAAIGQTFTYLPGTGDGTNGTSLGITQEHVVGAPEPKGYTEQVAYDSLYRTIEVRNDQGLATTTQWDPAKDLALSTTDPTGLETTTIYDNEDRPVTNYGPAPSSWFGSDRTPLAQYASQVARSDAVYDQNINGPAVAWYNLDSSTMSFTGAPAAHTTGFGNSNQASMQESQPPFTPSTSDGSYGFVATGKITFPQSGTYTFTAKGDNSMGLLIDGTQILNNWGTKTTGTTQNALTGSFAATAGKAYSFEYLYGHTGAVAGSTSLSVSGPGVASTSDFTGLLKPDYSLTTGSTTYDSTYGNETAALNYGNNPQLGQMQSSTADPTGQNLTSHATYETPGSGYNRQLTDTSPDGATTTYSYYGANDTAANPCVEGSPATLQAGMLKSTTDPTGLTSTVVYDDAGNIVATKSGNDGWECKTYDVRGRITEDDVPAANGAPARTITYNYAVDGNPLVTSETDDSGTITTTTDLLGRTLSTTDTYGITATTTYNDLGEETSDTGPAGTTTYSYDDYGNLIDQKFNGNSVAQPTYDQYGRPATIAYPTAGITEAYTYDQFGDESESSFALPNAKTITDSATFSQSGMVMTDTTDIDGQSSTWHYNYDTTDRLAGATTTGAIGNNTYAYGFGTEDSSCNGQTGDNPNAGLGGNRTSMTVNGATTTYCYNTGDQLISSSDQSLTNAQYDSHGNTISLGTGANQTTFAYDASDRNTAITQGNNSTTYVRDANDNIIARTTSNGTTSTTTKYSFGVAMDSGLHIQEEYLSLPGDISLTIRPDSHSASTSTVSITNLHGDTMATLDADGTITGTFAYDPFGNLVTSAGELSNLNNGQPVNAENGSSFGWGSNGTEATLALQPIQMGDRVYIPGLGRFLQTDPIPGGNENAYTYPNDPINNADYSGDFSLGNIVKAVKTAVSKVVKVVVKAVTSAVKAAAKVVATAAKVVTKAVAHVVSAVVNTSSTRSSGSAAKSTSKPTTPAAKKVTADYFTSGAAAKAESTSKVATQGTSSSSTSSRPPVSSTPNGGFLSVVSATLHTAASVAVAAAGGCVSSIAGFTAGAFVATSGAIAATGGTAFLIDIGVECAFGAVGGSISHYIGPDSDTPNSMAGDFRDGMEFGFYHGH